MELDTPTLSAPLIPDKKRKLIPIPLFFINSLPLISMIDEMREKRVEQ